LSSSNSLILEWRPLRYRLAQPLKNAHGTTIEQRGWLLKLSNQAGDIGWGEVLPPLVQWHNCAAAIGRLGLQLELEQLELQLPLLPGALAFGLGLALAELQGLCEGWLEAPPSAWLLPAGAAAIPALENALNAASTPITVKWKVATQAEATEKQLLKELLELLPTTGRLRLDANAGWDQNSAGRWVEYLGHEPRLEWLEQPLPPGEHQGLLRLARLLPIALDESLRDPAGIPPGWCGWRVHKPALEGDPRSLLQALTGGAAKIMISTAFGTGISNRFLAHLAALQIKGPTPCAPGLAPGWGPEGALASANPEKVWEAAGEA